MKKFFIVTGAAGHLGSNVLKLLSKKGYNAKGLILKGENPEKIPGVEYFTGDVTDMNSLCALMNGIDGKNTVIIHTAGIVGISDEFSPKMYEVNVLGTQNMINAARKYNVSRFVYVSSVHAIPEGDSLKVIRETQSFCPDDVHGFYAKTKAEATERVLEAAKHGLDAVVVHPSGIIGPGEAEGNHLVQLISDYMSGKLPACVEGGYDFVDVRDVAQGCISAAFKGKRGQCYILSNRSYEVKEILSIVKRISGGKKLPVLPAWVAKAAVPFAKAYAHIRHRRPLYTAYSIYTLQSNHRFSHDKATVQLGYNPRDIFLTVRDTVAYILKRKTAKA